MQRVIPKHFIRIDGIHMLHAAAQLRRAVICKSGLLSHRPFPAAFVMNMTGNHIYQAICQGLYIYEKPKKVFKK